MENNYFIYSDAIYRQIKGVAMGTNGAPSFANLVLGHKEWLQQLHYKDKFPKVYGRFIDDGFFIDQAEQTWFVVTGLRFWS